MKRSDWVLAVTAFAVFVLVVVRACLQAITIDEATTFVLFIEPDLPQHWIASTNNHVLNTALMRFATLMFGVREWSARLPALLGAAIYIVGCVRLCRRIESGLLLRWLALMCLISSPFILDYLVAARGYSLALGFLMTALLCDPHKERDWWLASLWIGLCFVSNFSFAFVCAAVLGGLMWRSWRGTQQTFWKLLAAYAVPAILVTWVVAAPSLLSFPRDELWYGAHSLTESFGSLLESQTRHLNLWLLGIPVYRVLYYSQPFIYPLFAAVAIAWVVLNWRRAPSLARFLGGVFAATVTLHFVGFHLAGLLYPLDRTGIFFVPLIFGAIASMAALPATARMEWLRRAMVAMLALVVVNNVACLRWSYFEEWNFDQDTDRVYSVLACLHRRGGVERVASTWAFQSTLKFYRAGDRRDKIETVVGEGPAAVDADAFVIHPRTAPWTSGDPKFTSLWQSAASGTHIMVPVDQAARLRGLACFD